MVDIEDFRPKWNIFKAAGRPARISRFLRGDRVSQDDVAKLLPRNATSGFPATGEEDNLSMSGSAFGAWLAKGRVPDDRVSQFESLTGLGMAHWTSGLDRFEAIVRREAGEVTDWVRYLDGAKCGQIRVHVFDGEVPSRFTPAGAKRPGSAGPTQVWPGCRAYVEIPRQGSETSGSARRAWMVADYPTGEIYVLDPTLGRDGRGSPSRLGRETRLPRSNEGYVELGTEVTAGTTFVVAVLIVDLKMQREEVVTAFDRLESRLLSPSERIFSAAQHRNLRKALDDAATLITDADVPATLHAERCLVVPTRGRPAVRHDDA